MKKWRFRAAFPMALSLSVLFMSATARAQGEEVTREKVNAALPVLEKMAGDIIREGGVPGMSIAVVYKDEVVYLKGFGVREAGKPETVDADTVFQIASLSKPISSTIVAALVGEKIVSWDDRVSQRAPEFQFYEPYVTREITLRDLFCHRSGLLGTAGDDLEGIGYDRDAILSRQRLVRPSFPFRAGYSYSNFGLTMGAVAAARPTGKAWEDVAAEKLYRPLGMNSTSSRYADFIARKNHASLHVRVAGKWVAKFTRQPDAQAPAGGVSSTARDLTQWLRLELSNGKIGGKQIVAADALAQTHIPQIVRGSNPVTGGVSYYALGWGVDYDERGRIFWAHAGAFSVGAHTQAKLLPAESLGIVVLSNAFPNGVPDALADAFFDQVLNAKQSRDWLALWNKAYSGIFVGAEEAAKAYAKPPANAAPALPLSSYVGVYRSDYFGPLEIRESGGALTLTIGPKKMPYPLRHWNRDMFLQEAAPELPGLLSGVTFIVGPDGKAQKVNVESLDNYGLGDFVRIPPQGP